MGREVAEKLEMRSEEHKQVARRFIEDGIVKGDTSAFEETVAENVVAHFLSPGRPPGRAGIMEAAASWRSSFPDTRPGIEHAVAEGDLVVLRGVSSFTHKGEFMGIPPTGKKVTAEWMDLYRFENGKIVEMWAVQDIAGVLEQLGALLG